MGCSCAAGGKGWPFGVKGNVPLESIKWNFLQTGTWLSAPAASAGHQRPGALGPNFACVCVREAHQKELPDWERRRREVPEAATFPVSLLRIMAVPEDLNIKPVCLPKCFRVLCPAALFLSTTRTSPPSLSTSKCWRHM